MKQGLKNAIKYVLSLAVAAVLLFFCFRDVKWSEFAANLSQCRWWWVAASILVGVISNWLRGERWREILLPLDADTRRLTSFNAVNIGYLANFVFPRIGEFVRCGVISKNSKGGKAGYDRVLGTVVSERSIDLLAMLLILIVFLFFKRDEFGSFFVGNMWVPLSHRLSFSPWWIAFALVLLACLLLFVLVCFRSKSVFAAKICGFCKGIWTGAIACLKMKNGWKFLIYTLLIWAMYFLMSYTSLRAVPLLDSLTAVDALFLMLVGSLGWVVPVPGGFGAFHYVVALALSTVYQLPFELGIVFATISHESQSLMMAVTGFGSYMYETFKN